MEFKSLLSAKKKGELTQHHIDYFVSQVASDSVSQRQITDFIKIIDKYGCSDAEVFYLANAMADSGIKLNLGTELGLCVDKHSAGSVSDGTSLLLMSILASLNINFVKVVSNVYGNHGNLLDKLNKFKGFNAMMSKEELLDKVNFCSVGILENDGSIAPAAGKLYSICKENELLIEPIVSASIMANKIATGANLLIIDVKDGEGSVVGQNNAITLANRLVNVGKLANIKTVAIITDLNWPISASVGTSLELQEIKDTLSKAKEYVGSNILKLAEEMTVCTLMASGKATTRSKAVEMFEDVVNSGKAYNKFCQIIDCYGGSLENLSRTQKLVDTAVSYITADFSGYVTDIMLDKLYSSIKFLISNKGEYDSSAGIVLMCAEGDKVAQGQKLAKVFYSHDNNRYFKVADNLYRAFKISNEKPIKNNLFYKVVI